MIKLFYNMTKGLDSFFLGLAASRANVSVIVIINGYIPCHSLLADIASRTTWALVVYNISPSAFKSTFKLPTFVLIFVSDSPARDLVQAF
mgnify:CR=1 FL=1